MDAQSLWTPLMVPKQGNWRTDEKSDPRPWVAEPGELLSVTPAWARKQASVRGKSCQDLEEWSSPGLGSTGWGSLQEDGPLDSLLLVPCPRE